MRFFNVGDKWRDLCLDCGGIVPATFTLRPVILEESRVTVPDVLVSVCDECGVELSTPPQSEPLLKEARERAADKKLTARVTRSADDALRVIADTLNVSDSALRGRLFTYYFRQMIKKKSVAGKIARMAKSDLTNGAKPSRVEVRVGADLLEEVLAAARDAGLTERTKLLEGIVALAREDVLERGSARRRNDLRQIAASL